MTTVPKSLCEGKQNTLCSGNQECGPGGTCLSPDDFKNPFKELTLPGSCVVATKNMCNAISQLPYECPKATGPVSASGSTLNLPVACQGGLDDINVADFCVNREGQCRGASCIRSRIFL